MGDRSRTSIQPNEEPQSETNTRNHCDKVMTAEPVSRSRWMPKPEQILILESIFNSGMVNPPKDETVRIRKLLEKFGAVGDANVFYWFQNRRSRSRRRQRQMQAAMAADPRLSPVESRQLSRGAILCSPSSCLQQASPSSTSSSSSNPSTGGGGVCASTAGFLSPSSAAGTGGCFSSSCGLLGDDGADDLFTISRQMGFPELGESKPILLNSSSPDLHYQSAGPITVFINGVPSEVPRGPMDMRAVFGNDVMLVHSSGEVVPTTEGGVLFQGLQMGESYFLVTKPTL